MENISEYAADIIHAVKVASCSANRLHEGVTRSSLETAVLITATPLHGVTLLPFQRMLSVNVSDVSD